MFLITTEYCFKSTPQVPTQSKKFAPAKLLIFSSSPTVWIPSLPVNAIWKTLLNPFRKILCNDAKAKLKYFSIKTMFWKTFSNKNWLNCFCVIQDFINYNIEGICMRIVVCCKCFGSTPWEIFANLGSGALSHPVTSLCHNN